MKKPIKDKAASSWHAPRTGAKLCDVFRGEQYADHYRLYEIGFVSGYRAAQRDAKKRGSRK